MTKNYVLDTNVLLSDPNSITAFKDNNVIIPIYVIEELDKFKKESSFLGRSARQVSRLIDAFSTDTNFVSGAILPNGGKLFIVDDLSSASSVDDKIISVAVTYNKSLQTIIVSKDLNVRLKARAKGLQAEDYINDNIDIDELPSGYSEIYVEGSIIDLLFETGSCLPEACTEVPLNSFVILRDITNPSHSALTRMLPTTGKLSALRSIPKSGVFGIRPKNVEQQMLLDLLLDDSIKLVLAHGQSGCGKTILSIASALHKTMEEERYSKVLITRPTIAFSSDIGWLPGDLSDKMSPWLGGFIDNIDYLLGFNKREKTAGRSYKELMDLGILQMEALSFIRGRSIPNMFIIVDECQLLSKQEIKTIVTRVGEGSKLVLSGDIRQIDTKFLDAINNGLTYVTQKFVGNRLAGVVQMKTSVRSELAEEAIKLL